MARNDGGLLFGCSSWRRAHKIQEAIERDGQFTTVIDSAEVSLSQPELVLVSIEREGIEFVGLARPGRRVATGQKTVAISHLVGVSLDRERIDEMLDAKFASRIHLGAGLYRLPPKTWQALLAAVRATGKNAQNAVSEAADRLKLLRAGPRRLGSDFDLFEHDAVATALEVWGGTRERKRLLRSATLAVDHTAPFLERLGTVSLREDPQINHDAQTIPGMLVARRYQMGIAVLENYRERLTIINSNRQKLEETLGVDLVYYNHAYRSFVMVQYKRMTRRNAGKAGYRPGADGSHQAELDRMLAVDKELRGISCKRRHWINGYRLQPCPFFFKLCHDRVSRGADEGMTSGMYFPLALWRAMLRAKRLKGKRGSTFLTWDNCLRRFNNSEFTSLLRNGWIGSTPTQSGKLDDIIEAALGEKKMVVYAATSPSLNRDDYWRDELGRFASEDDPFASK